MTPKALTQAIHWAERMAPRPIGYLKMLIRTLSNLQYIGNARYCPVCEKSSRAFKPYGVNPRPDAQCPHCGALERHRFTWKYFQLRTNLFSDRHKKILHIAPENCFEPRLRKYFGTNYLTADISNTKAMVKMDIMDIQFPDCSFNVVYCSHVLEHVENDRQALHELFRILTNDGWAVILVPIYSTSPTFEDASITTPQERRKAFGQDDHLRRYGPDFVDRLTETGFNVTKTSVFDLFENNTIARMGLTSASGDIFYCVKEPLIKS